MNNDAAARTCRYCGTALTYLAGNGIHVDANRSRACRDGRRHMPAAMRTSDLFDLIFGDDGRDDALTASLRRAGN